MVISARIKNEEQYEYLRKNGVNISRLVDKAIGQCCARCIAHNNCVQDLFY